MKKKNQSNQLARECIVTALIQLAMQKPFSAITISELTQKAGVSRMTYYRNYTSKEEVFQEYMKDIVIAYKRDMEQTKKPKTYGEYENILRCFRYFEKYREFIICLLNIGMGKLLLDAVCGFLLDTYYTDQSPSAKLYYALLAYAGALCTVYMGWMANNSQESLETLAHIIHSQTLSCHPGKDSKNAVSVSILP